MGVWNTCCTCKADFIGPAGECRVCSDNRRLGSFPYVYSWGPRGNLPGAMARKGERCRILAPPAGKKAGMNSALVEFVDGGQEVISRNALRRYKRPL